MRSIMSALAALVLVVVVIGGFVVTQYNALARKKIDVDEAFSQIEVQLQRRSDLIPNLVETVKGYASHEKDTLDKVIQARSAATSAQGVQAVAAADGSLTGALRGLLMVSEAYPDLKASSNFLALQEELASTENKISFARQFYNDSVRTLNTAITVIPGRFFAGMADASAREFYEVTDPGARGVPTVEF